MSGELDCTTIRGMPEHSESLSLSALQVERLKERLGEVEGAVAQLRTTGAAKAAGVPSPTVAAGGPPQAAAAEVAELRERLATAQADAAAAAAQRESLQHEATQLRSQVSAFSQGACVDMPHESDMVHRVHAFFPPSMPTKPCGLG